jgi:pimeloyl-ACP methyl ester carboxylesterase
MVNDKSLVFLHGAGGSRTMWAPQLTAFPDAVAIDLPGHGARVGERFSFDRAVEVVHEELAGRAPAVLVGLSLGGYVAMAYAARHPDRTAGLVLSGSAIDYRRHRILVRVNRIALAVWPERWLVALQTRALRRAYPDHADAIVAGGVSFGGMRDAFALLARTDWRAPLSGYPHPVLVLTGEHDRRNLAAQGDQVAAIPDASATVLGGAGHACNLDRPEEFTAAVRDFVGRVG